MTVLKDYSEVAQEPLVLPIGGKNYTVPELGVVDGLKLAEAASGKDTDFARDTTGIDLWKMLLGPVWDEMAADGVTFEAASRAGMTALADAQYGRKFAEATWEHGLDQAAIIAALADESDGA